MSETFVESCLAGRANLVDIDDFVERWHTTDGPPDALDEFLGFTIEEYSLWVEDPGFLPYIVEAHRLETPVTELVAQAASSSEHGPDAAVHRLVRWLDRRRQLAVAESR